jgi:hypothetical protein
MAGELEHGAIQSMDLSRRLIGVSAVVSADGKVTDVDIKGFVRRLLLFDKYVLVTIKLEEFPFIARYLGYEGLRDLLAADTRRNNPIACAQHR